MKKIYIGTTCGCLIFEAKTMRPITVFRHYKKDFKANITFKYKMNLEESAKSSGTPEKLIY
jgi:hypothetical protein